MAGYIDTRDLNVRLGELEDMVSQTEDITEEINVLDEVDDFDDIADLEVELEDINREFDEDEYEVLYQMRYEIPEWEHGNVLVPEDEWVDYVKEMLEDIGEMPRDVPWYIVIDWESTADNIQQDYSCIEYEGTDYWFRNC